MKKVLFIVRRICSVWLCCLMLCICASALAQEASFYTLTYHSNLGEFDSSFTQAKDHGEAVTIEDSNWGKTGQIFAGWATTPDAAQAEYLPGDTYTADENLDLYAVWMEAYNLGEITGPTTLTVPAFPVDGERVYLTFIVTQSDYYRLQSLDESMKNATTFSSIEIMKKDGNSWETVSRGEYIVNEEEYRCLDFTVAAQLEAGEVYCLSYCCAPDTLKLEFENRISFVTYHSNLGYESTTTDWKEPGEALTIEDSNWGKTGQIFAGWATTPDAAQAEYLPGDTYTADENLDLYAVWMEAYNLGEITGPTTLTVPAFPVDGERVYLTFTVTQSDYYRLQSLDESMKNATTFSSIEIMKKDGNSWETVSRGEYIMNEEEYRYLDFTVAAQLEAGEVYCLSYCCAPDALKLEFENRISFVTYHSNLGYESTTTNWKEPGEALTIEDSHWGKVGQIFAGWATTPDAAQAEYLPGDTYTADENLDLYAVWMEAYNLGEITGPTTLTVPAFPVDGESVYLTFAVSESGYYRLQSQGESMKNATTFSSIEIMKKDGNSWETVSRGEYIMNEEEYRYLDFTVAAQLEAGEVYCLSYCCAPDALQLYIEPQYAPEPYTARITLPASLKTVEAMLFSGTAIESVYIPEGVESISAHAFDGCEGLTKVVIASPDVQIDPDAFSGCADLLIVAPLDSTAYDFAAEHGYEFRRLP